MRAILDCPARRDRIARLARDSPATAWCDTTTSLKPIYLLADSGALFSAEQGRPLLRDIVDAVDGDRPRAAYIGASNGDDPVYYAMFEAAMDIAGVAERRMIGATFPSTDASFLSTANVILLAGGDARRGWRAMQTTGMTEVLRERYAAGAVLIGVSAGAVLLGEKGWGGSDGALEVFDALGLVPFTVDARDEANEWRRLRRLVAESAPHGRGVGLPSGSGLVCHADATLEPLRRPVVELTGTDRLDDAPTLLVPPTVSA